VGLSGGNTSANAENQNKIQEIIFQNDEEMPINFIGMFKLI
jgi:hypothetical protein